MIERKLRTGASHLRPSAHSVLGLVGAPIGIRSQLRPPVESKHLIVAFYEDVPETGLSKISFSEFRETDPHGGKLGLSLDGHHWIYQPVSGHTEQYRVGVDVRIPEQGETILFYGPAMVIDKRNQSQRLVLDRFIEDFNNGLVSR